LIIVGEAARLESGQAGPALLRTGTDY